MEAIFNALSDTFTLAHTYHRCLRCGRLIMGWDGKVALGGAIVVIRK